MTSEKLAEYACILQAKRQEMSARPPSTDMIAIEAVPDSMDQLVFANERELAVESLNRQASILYQINRALARIEKGQFGICLHCGQTISRKRLAALPWAALCIGCQEEADHETPHETSRDYSSEFSTAG